ncbi:SDR family NAD(P)-dependent oxidoreductase [Nitrosomonas sp. Nm34]|uniref:SDR family NAD(P)-dependent oxidoreductase n=1 Tax=Nitrosomonas sp. Nm34 TaxID=1881055 RepID=UPI001C31BD30|nr:SDR family NAD(P)-dependent oxidoreductase [Nitrosomonas sp. Nm34]
MSKAALPSMRQQRHGHTVNITSMAGYAGLSGIPYYSASKFALEGIIDVLSREVRDLGIKITAMVP